MADPDFRMEVRTGPAVTELVLRGTISERTELALPEQIGAQVVVDASGVERINSMGVRTWISFIDRLTALGVPVTVRRLSPVLVIQASMISAFLGRAQIESFLAPYYCPGCDGSFEQPFGISDPVPDALACPKCGAAMELDADRDAYLAFRGG